MAQIVFGLGALGLMLVLLVVCLTGWTWVYFRVSRGEAILQQESGETISWGLIDIVALIVTVAVLIGMFQVGGLIATGAKFPINPDTLTTNQRASMIMAFAAAELLTVLAIAKLISLRGFGLQLFGKRGEQFSSDLLLGCMAFGMLVVPTLILQTILALLQPYEHELINMLIKDRSVPMAFASVAAAVFAAPLFEEFAFRGLLQGWLQDMWDGRLSTASVFVGRIRRYWQAEPLPELVAATATSAESAEVASSFADSSDNPFDSPQSEVIVASAVSDEALPIERSPAQLYGPILISAALFALMHLGQGLAPIPLFFLALGLGYLYQRTRRLTPCVVVHFLLNGQSMALLMIQVFVVGDDAALIAN
ncbi:CPBP family intramembrane glutamic endopeptidase [Blastopirellula retiformator]|uniref:CAAX amino terminal protease self-immunity n=1 Tax=Blastopirellula retiformator TaxID=2527970 RepID=A0A5C5V7J0_9BACT|nr:CPBP family intramembrane glutamic endopeptidase [Blastopirellula retiformator]TWT34241.1 CAAX amino terminal protease self- immunity [Blastopirellula retiformator]